MEPIVKHGPQHVQEMFPTNHHSANTTDVYSDNFVFFVLIWISRFQISGCRRQRWTNFQIPSQILTGPLFQRTQGSNTLQGARSPTCDFIWCPTSATLPENDCLQAIPNGAIIKKVGVKGFQVGRILVRGWVHGPPTMLWRPQGGQVGWTHHCFQMIPA